MSRLFVAALAALVCLPVTLAGDFKVLNAPSPGDPVYVIPPGICGNGVVEDGEDCDPGYPGLGIDPDLGGATCESQGFNGGGEVICSSRCTVDTNACDCEAGAKFPATGQMRCSDVNGILIDCTGTGHDGDTRAGGTLSYTDNGDGTITDENTALMWEKKDDAGKIHDKDNRYTWETTFTDFIDKLNNTCEGDGLVVCDSGDICGSGGQCGFAGYRDWRMPNMKELVSIEDLGRFYPPVDPAFNAGCVPGCADCSCTVPYFYWSSSSAAASHAAWRVEFRYGFVGIDFKYRSYHVRGVRGGLD